MAARVRVSIFIDRTLLRGRTPAISATKVSRRRRVGGSGGLGTKDDVNNDDVVDVVADARGDDAVGDIDVDGRCPRRRSDDNNHAEMTDKVKGDLDDDDVDVDHDDRQVNVHLGAVDADDDRQRQRLILKGAAFR